MVASASSSRTWGTTTNGSAVARAVWIRVSGGLSIIGSVLSGAAGKCCAPHSTHTGPVCVECGAYRSQPERVIMYLPYELNPVDRPKYAVISVVRTTGARFIEHIVDDPHHAAGLAKVHGGYVVELSIAA